MDAQSRVGGVGGGGGVPAAAANKAQAASVVGRYAGTAGPRPTTGAGVQRAGDQVDFSSVSRSVAPFIEKLKKGPQIREAVVAQVRKEIAEGSYDTPQKMDEALDGMIDDVLEDQP
ncbi:MAG: flagellar biosynthesis anti-sigma factor FlgM [Phycisphaerales bacterium]|nr:flagellar biosynthesis anti-sigma factor FlgM [Phycisphaerales bacterium]